MNYLQLKDDSTFAPEEAVLAEYFGEGNYVPFHAKEILQRRIKLRLGDFVAGGLQVTLPALKQLGVNYRNDDYPLDLAQYLHRNIWSSSMKYFRQRIENEGEDVPVFIKPLRKVKRFTGRVISARDDLAPLGNIGGSIELYCSEPVQWVSEYRVPVIHGKIQGYFWYDGDRNIMVDKAEVEKMAHDYVMAPWAYCLDVGVLGTGETALVEMNDAFSIGMYEGMEKCYGDLLTTRWKELTFKAIKPYFAAIGAGPYCKF
jgi:hypothetical protein